MADYLYSNFINNRWAAPADGPYLDTVNSATEEPITRFARSGAKDVDAAVRSAHNAMSGDWSKLSPAERGQLLFQLADLITVDRDRLERFHS